MQTFSFELSKSLWVYQLPGVMVFGGSWHSDRKGVADSYKVKLVVQLLEGGPRTFILLISLFCPQISALFCQKMLEDKICFVDSLKGIDW